MVARIGRMAGAPKAPAGPVKANLLARYDFRPGSDPATLYDLSGNGKHGTLVAGKEPAWVEQGLQFSGGQAVSVPPLRTSPGEFTLMLAYNQTDTSGMQFVFDCQTGRFVLLHDPNETKAQYFFSAYNTYYKIGTGWRFVSLAVREPDVTVYLNGIRCYKGAGVIRGLAGQIGLGASYDASAAHFRGVIGCVYVYGACLSDAQHYQTYRYAVGDLQKRGAPLTATSTGLICDGDSLTKGQGAPAGQDYPSQVAAMLPGTSVLTFGVAGQRITTMGANAPSTIDPCYTPGIRSICCCWGGSNDIAIFGANAADTYQAIASYCQGRRAAGFKVVVFTLLPRSDSGIAANFETHRQSVNASIRANWREFADALADVAADGRIGDPGDSDDTTYYSSDKIHMNAAGYAVVAGIAQAAIATV